MRSIDVYNILIQNLNETILGSKFDPLIRYKSRLYPFALHIVSNILLPLFFFLSLSISHIHTHFQALDLPLASVYSSIHITLTFLLIENLYALKSRFLHIYLHFFSLVADRLFSITKKKSYKFNRIFSNKSNLCCWDPKCTCVKYIIQHRWKTRKLVKLVE